jgi:predicted DNA-binding transcriptional regulator AlpA
MDEVEDRYMNTVELRNYMSVSKATLWRIMNNDEKMPRPFKVGERGIRWKKSEIDQWLEQTRS